MMEMHISGKELVLSQLVLAHLAILRANTASSIISVQKHLYTYPTTTPPIVLLWCGYEKLEQANYLVNYQRHYLLVINNATINGVNFYLPIWTTVFPTLPTLNSRQSGTTPLHEHNLFRVHDNWIIRTCEWLLPRRRHWLLIIRRSGKQLPTDFTAVLMLCKCILTSIFCITLDPEVDPSYNQLFLACFGYYINKVTGWGKSRRLSFELTLL